jgi:hypothetical protein
MTKKKKIGQEIFADSGMAFSSWQFNAMDRLFKQFRGKDGDETGLATHIQWGGSGVAGTVRGDVRHVGAELPPHGCVGLGAGASAGFGDFIQSISNICRIFRGRRH